MKLVLEIMQQIDLIINPTPIMPIMRTSLESESKEHEQSSNQNQKIFGNQISW